MGFVGNYAPRGLAPQIDDMPVIPKKRRCLTQRLFSGSSLLTFLKQQRDLAEE